MKKILIIAAAFFLAFCAFYFSKNLLLGSKTNDQPLIKEKPEKTAFNFLLLGYGGGAHEGTYLTDTMMVAHIDVKLKKVILFSIPRDLWVKLPTKSGDDFHTKINAVYQVELFPKNYPNLEFDHKKIISQITGLPIDGYVSVNFEGFTKAIDILGGVDINVQRSFTDTQYPIGGKEKDLCDQDTEDLFKKAEPYISPPVDPTVDPEERLKKFAEDPKIEEFVKNATDSPELAFPCRYEKIEFTRGITHMDGQTALKYARSRHSKTDGGDFNRATRQQQIIEAVKEKVLSIGFVPKIIPLIEEYKKDVKTDISLDIIKKLFSQADKSMEYKITTLVLTDQNVLKNAISDDKQFILIPKEGMDNWKGIQKVIKNAVEDVTPTPIPSSSAKKE